RVMCTERKHIGRQTQIDGKKHRLSQYKTILGAQRNEIERQRERQDRKQRQEAGSPNRTAVSRSPGMNAEAENTEIHPDLRVCVLNVGKDVGQQLKAAAPIMRIKRVILTGRAEKKQNAVAESVRVGDGAVNRQQ